MTRRSLIAALLISSVICGGCYDKVELNQLAVADLMALDLSEDGKLLVSLQFLIPGELANPGGGGGAGQSNRDPFYVIDAEGATLLEALSLLQAKLPRRLFTSHIRVVVIGEELAKAGIAPVFDSLTRMRELRITMDVVLARGKAVELLRAAPRFEQLPAQALANLLNQRVVPNRTVRQVVISLAGEGMELFLPVVGLASRIEPMRGGEEGGGFIPTSSVGEFEITGIGIFRDDRLVGFAPNEAARGLSWLLDRISVSTATLEWPPPGEPMRPVPSPQATLDESGRPQDDPPGSGPGSPGAGLNKPNQVSLLLLRATTRVRSVVRDDGQIVIRVDARAIDDLITNQAGIDLTDPSTIPRLEAAVSAQVEERIAMILHLAQDVYQSDIFGFGAMIRRQNLDAWRQVRDDWPSAFAKLPVEVNVDVQIRRVGLTSRPASLRGSQLQR